MVNPEEKIKRVVQLLHQERYQQASSHLEALVNEGSLDKQSLVQCLQTLTVVLVKLGRTKEALECSERGLSMDPRNAGLHHSRGLLLFAQGNNEEALYHLRMARNNDPKNPQFRQDLVDYYRLIGAANPEEMAVGAEERMYFTPDPELKIPCNDYDPENVRRHVARYEFAKQLLEPGWKVLDAACGSGYGSEILAGKVAEVTAIDIDAESIEYARRHHLRPNVNYQIQDLNRLALPPGLADAVVSLETLEHLPDPRPFLNRIVRILKGGGVFIVSTPVSTFGGPSPYNPYHVFEYTREQFERLLNAYFEEYAIHIEHLDSRIEPLLNQLPQAGFYVAVCRGPRNAAYPEDGLLTQWLQELSEQKPARSAAKQKRNVAHVALIMAKGKDRRDYGIPLGLGSIAAFLEVNVPGLRVTTPLSEEELGGSRPDLVGISCVSSTYDYARNLAIQIRKRWDVPVVVGGPHISHLPSSLDPVFLAGIIGEGEVTMLELLRALNAGQDLETVPGLVIHGGNGAPSITAARPVIEELDRLPLPRRSPNPEAPDEATLFTSRGCPYRCAFCSSSIEPYREFSAEYVANEIDSIFRNFPQVKRLYFLDDLFVANRERLRKIVGLLDARGLLGRFSGRCFVRANLMDEELAGLLKRMNFSKVRFGAESGSEKILRKLKCGSVSVADSQRCVDICHEMGLPVSGSFVFGTPGETAEDIQATFDFIDRNCGKMDVEGFYLLMPLPGTEMWPQAKAAGAVSETMEWSRLNLDMNNPDFDWENFIYFNDALPRAEFIAMIRNRLGLPPLKNPCPAKAVAGPKPAKPPLPLDDCVAGVKLNIGSGPTSRPGYLNVDIRPLPNVHIQSEAWSLPFEQPEVAEIYSRHSLEHYTKQDGRKALREWHRVLKSGGRVHIIVPNIEFHMRQWREGDRDWAMAGFWGWQEHEHDLHKWGYTWDTLKEALVETGFSRVENLTAQHCSQEKDEKHLEVLAWKL